MGDENDDDKNNNYYNNNNGVHIKYYYDPDHDIIIQVLRMIIIAMENIAIM